MTSPSLTELRPHSDNFHSLDKTCSLINYYEVYWKIYENSDAGLQIIQSQNLHIDDNLCKNDLLIGITNTGGMRLKMNGNPVTEALS